MFLSVFSLGLRLYVNQLKQTYPRYHYCATSCVPFDGQVPHFGNPLLLNNALILFWIKICKYITWQVVRPCLLCWRRFCLCWCWGTQRCRRTWRSSSGLDGEADDSGSWWRRIAKSKVQWLFYREHKFKMLNTSLTQYIHYVRSDCSQFIVKRWHFLFLLFSVGLLQGQDMQHQQSQGSLKNWQRFYQNIFFLFQLRMVCFWVLSNIFLFAISEPSLTY